MKKRFQIVLVTALVFFLGIILTRIEVVKAQALQPVTVFLQETHYDDQGNVTDYREITEGLRSDGSVGKIIRMRSNKPEPTSSGFFENREILDRAKGVQTTASPDLGRKISIPAAVGPAPASRWPSDCVRGGFRGDHQFDKSILDEATTYMVREDVLSNGKDWVTKEWRAPALNCILLEREQLLTDGSHSSRAITIATGLQRGEPAVALFDVPAGLLEVTPSDMLRAVKDFEGQKVSDKCQETAKRADENYLTRRHSAGWK